MPALVAEAKVRGWPKIDLSRVVSDYSWPIVPERHRLRQRKEDGPVPFLRDANLDLMGRRPVPAGVRQRALDHGIAPHISVQEGAWAAVLEAAAGSRPVQTPDVPAPDTSQLSAVPLPPDFHEIVAGHEKIVEPIESHCNPLI